MSATVHPFAPEEIMAFIDGELSDDRAQSLSAHIGQCTECATLVTDLRGVSGQVSDWQIDPVPERLISRVTTAAALGGGLKFRHSPALRLTIKAAAVFAGLIVMLCISVPNLLRSKMAANEASAVGSLRVLNTAATTYSDAYGHYPPSLKSFGPPSSGAPTEDAAGLVDPALAGGQKSGYQFTYHMTPADGRDNRGGYAIQGSPLEPGKGGYRHFSTNETGAIFADGVELGGPSFSDKAQEFGQHMAEEEEGARYSTETPPMIARRADLRLLVANLDDARQAMDRILAEHNGYMAQLSASAESGSQRTVVASLRVPANQLDGCLAQLKKLGRATHESRAGEEVTQQHIDLVARLKNSRNTEARLNGVLQQHGGPVKEILEVEKESARVRGEIEQMEAEQQTLEHRVNFSTIDLTLAEEYKAELTTPAPSVVMQLRNALVDGFRTAFQSLLALVLFFAESGPTLLLWLMILSIPAWLLWRRYQRSLATGSPAGV
jgi:type IV pilus assembly protein PilA